MDGCSTIRPLKKTTRAHHPRLNFFIVVFAALFSVFQAPCYAAREPHVTFNLQEPSRRPLQGPTLVLKDHVRQVTSPVEVYAWRDEVLKELSAMGFTNITLDVQYVLDLARRGQIVAVDGTVDGKPTTWYGMRESLNEITPQIGELGQLYDQLEGPQQNKFIVLASGVGTSVRSATMKQWSDIDIDLTLVAPDFNGDPDALRNAVPESMAKDAAAYIQATLRDYLEKNPDVLFTELKAGSVQPEPFHPNTPPKGEKWSLREVMAGVKAVSVLDPRTGVPSSVTLTLAEAMRHDAYIKFDLYMDGIGDRKGELIEVTACYRLGSLTPNGQVYLRQSERQLHFPAARSTTVFPKKRASLLSIMANEFEYQMPTTPRANQLMVGKIYEVMGEEFARLDKANKTIAARMNFWHDVDTYRHLSGDQNATLEYLQEKAREIGNNPDVIRLANLLAEVKAFLENVDRRQPLHRFRNQAKINERITGLASRLEKLDPKLSAALLAAGLDKAESTRELSIVLHNAKDVVSKELSVRTKKLVDRYPPLLDYIKWIKDRFPYLKDGTISNRASLIAFPAPSKIKNWYAEQIKLVGQKFPLLMKHNPDDLHLTVLFAGNTTPQTLDAIHEKAVETFKGRRIPLKAEAITVLGSEGTYVGITFGINPKDQAVVRDFQHTAVALGSQPTRFLGQVHPHITLFWIPKNSTAEERKQFEEFKAWAIPYFSKELEKLLPDGTLLWSGVPMIAQTNRVEAGPTAPGAVPERVYKVHVPAEPVEEDIRAGLVDAPLGQEIITYNEPRDVVVAWDAPGAVVQWLDTNWQSLSKMFPLLSVTRPQNAHIALAYGKQVHPTDALTVDRTVLEPFATAEVIEEYPLAEKGINGKKTMRREAMVGRRLVYPVGFVHRGSQSLGTRREALALSLEVREGFRNEIAATKQALGKILSTSLFDQESAHLFLTIAREKVELDNVALTPEQTAKAKAQLATLQDLLQLPEQLEALIKQAKASTPWEASNPTLDSLMTQIFEKADALSKANSSAGTTLPPEVTSRLTKMMGAISDFRKQRSEQAWNHVAATVLVVDEHLVLRGIDYQPVTIPSRPQLYGVLPVEFREKADKKYIRLPIAPSNDRSTRERMAKCADVLTGRTSK